jgi:uncharacterized glyoxalase superfamily protein PhnB
MSRAATNRFLGIAPYLLVEDVVRAAEFYRDALGFSLDRTWGTPPFLAAVHRDGVRILLGNRGDGGGTPWRQAVVYITVEDVDALCREYRGRGVKIVRAPETANYGMREFVIEDGSGYLLCFGHSVRQTK